MSTSPQQRPISGYHGLYLVPHSHHAPAASHANTLYRIAAVGAALFLALTIG